MTPLSPDPLAQFHHSGTEVYYAALCERKLWWFTHGMEQEHTSDLVAQGRNIHETSYDRRRKELDIDGAIRIDGIEPGSRADPEAVMTIHEVKKSRAGAKAQRMQLLYYLYALRRKGIMNARGFLEYPKLRKRERVELTPEAEKTLQETLSRVDDIRASAAAPAVAEPFGLCANCAYQELCWG